MSILHSNAFSLNWARGHGWKYHTAPNSPFSSSVHQSSSSSQLPITEVKNSILTTRADWLVWSRKCLSYWAHSESLFYKYIHKQSSSLIATQDIFQIVAVSPLHQWHHRISLHLLYNLALFLRPLLTANVLLVGVAIMASLYHIRFALFHQLSLAPAGLYDGRAKFIYSVCAHQGQRYVL